MLDVGTSQESAAHRGAPHAHPVKRIGFYNPFLAALGGGDKYLLTILEAATKLRDTELVLFCPNDPSPEDWVQLGLAVPRAAFRWVPASDPVVTEQSNSLDLLVSLANDVPVPNHARRAVAVIQFPYRARDTLPFRARQRLLAIAGRERATSALKSYDRFICYSHFTRHWTRRRLGVEAMVIEPPVDMPTGRPPAKVPQILSVARFVEDVHDKRHDILIRAFGELWEQGRAAKDWSLRLVGTADSSSTGLLDRLHELARGLPVSFHPNASRRELDRLYGESAFFWHATGFGTNPDRHPERAEHFGIVTAEAMAQGAIPLVFAAGGSAEIVADRRTGRHWRTPSELAQQTSELIEDHAAAGEIRANAIKAARRYRKERFLESIDQHVFSLLE